MNKIFRINVLFCILFVFFQYAAIIGQEGQQPSPIKPNKDAIETNNLRLAEKLLLLVIPDTEYKLGLEGDLSIRYSLIASLLFELHDMGKIYISREIVVNDAALTGDFALDEVLIRINDSKKQKSPAYWIDKIGDKNISMHIVNYFLDQLTDKGLIMKKNHKFIIPYYSCKIKDSQAKEQIRQSIINILEQDTHPKFDEQMLIGLVHICCESKIRANKNMKDKLEYIVDGNDLTLAIEAALKKARNRDRS